MSPPPTARLGLVSERGSHARLWLDGGRRQVGVDAFVDVVVRTESAMPMARAGLRGGGSENAPPSSLSSPSRGPSANATGGDHCGNGPRGGGAAVAPGEDGGGG